MLDTLRVETKKNQFDQIYNLNKLYYVLLFI